MRRALSLAVLIPAVALAAPTPKKFTLAFMGDDGGEIAPCG